MSHVPAYHIMTKPIGSICNLDCKYCYYLEKTALYPATENFQMTPAVLEQYVRQYIESQNVPEVNFAWQGGEPTLLGVEFYRQAVEFQKKYANGKKIGNALQTNGVGLDDDWCSFFTEHNFLIGLSVDGPRELHDRYRVDKRGKSSFDSVMAGLALLKKHQTEFNTLTVVNRANSQKPLAVYQFLKQIGSGYMQFIPLVERKPDGEAKGQGLDYSEPPLAGQWSPSEPVTSWSVESGQYGEFLIQIFDEWVRQDVGKYFVQLFDVTLGSWMGLGASLCVFAETCGNALVLEHNGDLFACDHYVYPRYKLGNLLDAPLGELVNSPAQRKFGSDKLTTLPKYCRLCDVRFACNGECPKHRFLRTIDGEPGLNYLCAGYKRFFHHVDVPMRRMADLLQRGQPAALIMNELTGR